MIRSAFAIVLLAFGFTAVSPARADFAVIEFNSGYCRVWIDTAFGPEDGNYLWFYPHHGAGIIASLPLRGQTRRCIRLSPCIAVITGGSGLTSACAGHSFLPLSGQ